MRTMIILAAALMALPAMAQTPASGGGDTGATPPSLLGGQSACGVVGGGKG